MTDHKIGTREEWLAAREQLLIREKEHTRVGDELARARRVRQRVRPRAVENKRARGIPPYERRREPMTPSPAWGQVTNRHVERAIKEYDRLGPERFFSEHGFAPTTTYELFWDKRRYPPKAILGTAYELAAGRRLGSGDFEGGKTGAVKVLEKLGFTIQPKHRPAG
jgi:Bacterial protein of unknown function (DUF899)